MLLPHLRSGLFALFFALLINRNSFLSMICFIVFVQNAIQIVLIEVDLYYKNKLIFKEKLVQKEMFTFRLRTCILKRNKWLLLV